MPKTVAQWTGIAVTAIVVFGCDLDVIYAMPLGLLAGAIAAAVIALDDQRRAGAWRPLRLPPAPMTLRPQLSRAPER